MKKLTFKSKERQKRLMRKRSRRKKKRQSKESVKKTHFDSIKWSLSPVVTECLNRLRGNVSLVKTFAANHLLRSGKLKIPETLSFFDNPEDALQTLSELTVIGSADGVRKLFFDHSDCRNLELGASAVMDVITMELQKGWHKRQVKYELAGKSPVDEEVREIFFASGLPNSLKVDSKVTRKLYEKYIVFELMDGGKEKPNPFKSAKYEMAAQKLTDYFDHCLGINGFKLKPKGRHNLSLMIGEMLTNAEEHSNHGRWYVIGYLRKQGAYDEVNIAIFNFGNTIYESFLSPDLDATFKGKLELMSTLHQGSGYFRKEWDQETLWTLYSLQEGVSKFSGTERGFDRGSGTVRMIEFFQKLGKTDNQNLNPRMCLISGSTYILFDGTYLMKPKEIGDEWRSIVAFNDSNDLFRPPDSKYVRKLDAHFPGTIVSMKFYLDKQYLQKLLSQN